MASARHWASRIRRNRILNKDFQILAKPIKCTRALLQRRRPEHARHAMPDFPLVHFSGLDRFAQICFSSPADWRCPAWTAPSPSR
jgi:hypothetical protein